MSEELRVLCVDDEPRVLDGLENHLAMDYEVHLATSGAEGLELLEQEGPFALVISDMRMPEMNGAQFLSEARRRFPDCTRMLLTGQSDLESAVSAVNDGHIFRFLNKPCPPNTLLSAVNDAVERYRLKIAERELLEQTLNGTASVLAEVLGVMSPTAFSRANAYVGYVTHMCKKLDLESDWEFTLAARLCLLGCISVPNETLERHYAGQKLTGSEAEMFARHPEAAKKMLGNIPRLERVAEMIGGQCNPPALAADGPAESDQEVVALGANMLAIARAFDELLRSSVEPREAAKKLRTQEYPASLARLLRDFEGETAAEHVRVLRVSELHCSMILDEDVCTSAGAFVVAAGRQVTQPLLERLRTFSRGVGIREPIRVRVKAM